MPRVIFQSLLLVSSNHLKNRKNGTVLNILQQITAVADTDDWPSSCSSFPTLLTESELSRHWKHLCFLITILVQYELYMFPKSPCSKGLVPSPWCYWRAREPLVNGAYWKEVRSLGVYLQRGYQTQYPTVSFPPFSLLLGCHQKNKPPQQCAPPQCTMLPQAQKKQSQQIMEWKLLKL